MSVPCQLAAGDEVRWTLDDDQGRVARVLPGQAVAVAWRGLARTEWYSIPCGAWEFIEALDPKKKTP